MACTLYGQVVVGPPGSGKVRHANRVKSYREVSLDSIFLLERLQTTFCGGMQQYLRLLGRDAWIVNMDPANEELRFLAVDQPKAGDISKQEVQENGPQGLPYETVFNVCDEVVVLSSVMEKMKLGPNGGLLYCMEYLEAHIDEVIEKIKAKLSDKTYLLFDFPGQVELYTHSNCIRSLLAKLVKRLQLRLTAVQLVDAHYCTDASKFISAALLGTTTMIRLELPSVNVLSKVDLLSNYGELPMNFEFFTDCHDLDRLVPFLDDPHHQPSNGSVVDDNDYMDDLEFISARRKRRDSRLAKKYTKLHGSLAEVVEDYGLLSFLPLDISNAESVGRVLARIDKSNGYIFKETTINEDFFRSAVSADNVDFEAVADVHERVSTAATKEEKA